MPSHTAKGKLDRNSDFPGAAPIQTLLYPPACWRKVSWILSGMESSQTHAHSHFISLTHTGGHVMRAAQADILQHAFVFKDNYITSLALRKRTAD